MDLSDRVSRCHAPQLTVMLYCALMASLPGALPAACAAEQTLDASPAPTAAAGFSAIAIEQLPATKRDDPAGVTSGDSSASHVPNALQVEQLIGDALADSSDDQRERRTTEVAVVLCSSGYQDKAIDLLANLLLDAVRADRPISLQTIALLARTYRTADDLAGYEELVRHVPADYAQREALMHSLVTAYVDDGKFWQAIAASSDDLDARGANIVSLQDLAMAYEAAGDKENAADALERAAQLQNSAPVYFELGNHFLFLGDETRAMNAYANATRLDPAYVEPIQLELQQQGSKGQQ